MWIWDAGGAPPAGPGNAMSVLTAIRFQSATALPAGSALAGAGRPQSTTTSATAAAIDTRLDFIFASFAHPRALEAFSLRGSPRGCHLVCPQSALSASEKCGRKLGLASILSTRRTGCVPAAAQPSCAENEAGANWRPLGHNWRSLSNQAA